MKRILKPKPRCERRVLNPVPAPLVCPYDGGAVRLKRHEEVYGRAYSDWPLLYQCDSCGASVGVHPGTHIPLGTLADRATKEARVANKRLFLQVVSRMKSKSLAYQWLAHQLGIPLSKCHWGWFDRETAERAGRICARHTQTET